ncbi:PAS sensor protein, partial [Streptomyces sp. NPDC001274]
MDREVPGPRSPVLYDAATGRVPLAVAVVDQDGRISHWSSGAGRLFGVGRHAAIGSPAAELLPVYGALVRSEGTGEGDGSGPGPGGALDHPMSGRARLDEPVRGRIDVLWWAYPLIGPGTGRLLVLAADGGRPGGDGRKAGTAAPAFALHTDFPGSRELAGRLPEILPSMSVGEATRIVDQVLELGYPVLEFNHRSQAPVTPDWGVPRRPARHPAPHGDQERTPAPGAAPHREADLEHAAARERLEFLNEVSDRIGTSLDLARTIREVTSAAVPRFTDFAGTHLRAAVLAGEGFPDGPPDVTTVWHRVWVEHNDEPGRWDDTVPVGESIAFPEHTPFFRCMVTGEPVLVPYVDEELSNRISGEVGEAGYGGAGDLADGAG